MNKLVYGVVTIIIMLGFNGCVISTKNVQINKNTEQLKNKKLTYTTRVSNLQVLTPLKAFGISFSKIGSDKRREWSESLNNSNGDFSVSNYLSESLYKDMSKKYNLILNKKDNQNIRKYEVDEFVSMFADSDYIVDNYVSSWRVMYYKFKLGKYYIALTTKMRLIDVKNKKIISEGFCKKETQYDEDNPLTANLLFDNNAIGLIEETKKLSNECLEQYKKLLKL